MDEQGPSAMAVWKDVTSPDGYDHRELAGRPDGTSYLLPDRHRVIRDRAGTPRLGLTLVLAEVPTGDTADLLPLVRQGVLGLTVGLAPLPAPAEGQRPLFTRWARTTLLGPGDVVLATADSGGGSLAAPISVTLDRGATLEVWAALQDQDVPYALSTEFGYRAVTGPVRTRVSGRWVDLWQLAGRDDFTRRYAGRPVAEQVPALLRQGLEAGLIDLDPAVSAVAGLRPLITSCRSALFDGERLGPRPSDWFTFDLTLDLDEGATEQTVTVRTPLRQALAGCWAEAGDGLVTLVAVDPATGRTVVPRRSTQRDERGPGTLAPLRLATESNGAIRSVSAALALAPVARLPIADQLNRVGRPANTVGVHAATLDLVTDDAGSAADLPVLGDPAGWTFARRAGGAPWYAPTFQLRRPAATDTAGTSPFVFRFARHGATADGQPGIDAEVVVTLDAVLGPEATAALGGALGTEIPSEQLQVALDLPFRDDSGATQRQRFPGTVEWDGSTLVARVALLDHWARLAYGALSQPGFQSEPARLQVGWTFRAWQRIDLDTTVVWGNKYAQIPIIVQPPPAEVSLVPVLRRGMPERAERMRPIDSDGPIRPDGPRPRPVPVPVPVPPRCPSRSHGCGGW